MTSKNKTKDPLEYYTEDTELDAGYRERQKVLDTSKKKAQQSADVSYQTLLKYLPTQNRMNGMHGLGVSETSLIDANNRYQSRLAQIEAAHAAGSAELLANYRTEKKTEQDAVYQDAVSQLSSGTYTTNEDLDRYLERVAGSVSTDQAAHLEKMVEGMRYEKPRVADVRVAKEQGSYFVLNDGERDYEIMQDVNTNVSDEDVLRAAQEISNGGFFVVGDMIYRKIDGKVHPIIHHGDYDALYEKVSGKGN